MDGSQQHPQGLTRRELLKKGAAIGGALVWATPAVQLIGMTPALASHVSGQCLCVKITACNDQASWTVLGGDNPGNCLTLSDTGDCDREFPPDSSFVIVSDPNDCGADEFCLVFVGNAATIVFPEYCNLTWVVEKAGDDCIYHFTPSSLQPTNNEFHFTINSGASGCSHIEFCFDCS